MSLSTFNIENTLALDQRQERLRSAVDISATMDNCFFHAYALHLMANGLSFPDDLFMPYETDSSDIRDLKKIISSASDLTLFEDYDELTTGIRQDHLAEKVLVLGVLFRSWFIHRVRKNEKMMAMMFNDRENVALPFYYLVESFDAGEEWLRENITETTNLYKANQAYFDSSHLKRITENSARAFWEKEGYDNYLRYLNQAKVKIFVHEVEFMLRFNQLSYTIYNKLKTTISSENKADGPHLELAIHPGYEHFYLIANEKTAAFLERYTAQHKRSLEERTKVLSLDAQDKWALAKKSPFLLLEVTFPEADRPLEKNPLAVMTERLQELKSEINLQQGQSKHDLFSDSRNLIFSSDFNVKKTVVTTAVHPLNPLSDSTLTVSPESPPGTPLALKPAAISNPPTAVAKPTASVAKPSTEQEKNYAYALYLLEQKVLEFNDLSHQGKIPKYQEAYVEIGALHRNLKGFWDDYLVSDKDEAYEHFAKQSITEIAKNKKRIEHHRGVGKIVTNVLLGILGIGVFYFAVCTVKWAMNKHFFFKPNTGTANIIHSLISDLEKLTPPQNKAKDEAIEDKTVWLGV